MEKRSTDIQKRRVSNRILHIARQGNYLLENLKKKFNLIEIKCLKLILCGDTSKEHSNILISPFCGRSKKLDRLLFFVQTPTAQLFGS